MLICHKTALMQAIQDCVTNGYTKYVSDMIPGDKLATFMQKMDKKYSVNRHRQSEYRRRKMGLGNARLYVYPAGEFISRQSFIFFLLVSEGTHPAHTEEPLRDALQKRERVVLDRYELVRQTAPGKGTSTWTWRMTHRDRTRWEEILVKLARNDNTMKLKQAIYSLGRIPGFSGIRKDRRHLFSRIKSAWKKAHKPSDTMPAFPLNRWVRRVERKHVIKVQHFVNEMYNHDRTAMAQMRTYLANRNPKRRRKVADE